MSQGLLQFCINIHTIKQQLRQKNTHAYTQTNIATHRGLKGGGREYADFPFPFKYHSVYV